MKMTHAIANVTHEDLVCLLSMEDGGFDYWGYTTPDKEIYQKVKAEMKATEEWNDKGLCYEDILAEMLLKGYSIEIYNEEEEETYELTLEKVIKGMELNADNRPHDWSIEDGDAITGDCIMQYGLFGELVFG